MPLNRVSSTAWNPYSQNTTNFQFGNATYPSALIFNKPATNATGLVFYTQESGSDILTTRDATGNTRLSISDIGVLAGNAINLNNVQLNSTPLLTITNNLSSTVPMWIRGAVGQTNNLQEWQNSAASIVARILSDGQAVFQTVYTPGISNGATGSNAYVGVPAGGTIISTAIQTNQALRIINTNASPTADLTQWRNPADTVTLASINPSGHFSLPKINFIGGTTTISALTLADGTVSFEGTAGQLFSVSNSLTGTIFSINDISGLPSVEVTDLGIVKLNELYGQTVVGSGTPVTSAQLSAIARTSATIPLVVRGVSGQSVNLQEWQNNTPTTVASISNTGAITAVDLTLSGNLTVNGTTTNINTVNLVVEDKNIILGDVASPSTTTADGGGLTLLAGGSNKTFNWINATDRWTSSVGLEATSFTTTGTISASGLAGSLLTSTVGSTLATTATAGTATIPARADHVHPTTGLTIDAMLAASTNFNTVVRSGTYRFNNTNTNGPGVDWGQMLVIRGPGGDTITQIVGDYNTGNIYTRSGNPTDVGGSGAWTQWFRLVRSSETLAAFAATTSAQLAGVISDETGSGALVFGSSPTITTPTLTLRNAVTTSGAGDIAIAGPAAYISGQAQSIVYRDINNTERFAVDLSLSQTLSNKTLAGVILTGALNLNYASPTIASDNASAASIFTSNVTGITIGSSSIKTTAFPADGTTSTASASSGYMGMPQVQVTSGGRTLAATDAGKHIYMTTTSGQTLTIPANSAVAFPVGTTIVVVNANTISTSIAITTDTLRLANSTSTGTRTLASNGMCTLLKIANTEWIASGNGLT